MDADGHNQPKPLKEFNFGLVSPKLAGLRFNLDREIDTRNKWALQRGDADADRCLSLLKILFRFAWNSYDAVIYLLGDSPEDPRRKPNFVLVVVFKDTFGGDPEWASYLNVIEKTLQEMIPMYGITPEEQSDPELIPYWLTPFKLRKRALKEHMPCAQFLKYLEKWLYKDTSAQSHMTFGGVLKVAPFLLADLFGEETVKKVSDRPMKTYHFEQVSRTALSVLAICTEIDTALRFGNRDTINYLWGIFAEHAVEGKEMWEVRS